MAASQYVLTGDARLSDARQPAAGSNNYIQNNATSTAQTGSFNISGDGTIGGTLTVNGAGSYVGVNGKGSYVGVQGESDSYGVVGNTINGKGVFGQATGDRGIAVDANAPVRAASL